MELKVKDITTFLEGLAPLGSQESYDNSGLIVGSHDMEVTRVLLSLDCIEDTVEEAIKIGANFIIAHHPIVFSGLKQLNGKNHVEKTVIKAIKNDIAIYAIHTNLDHIHTGVNKKIADKIGLTKTKILSPKPSLLMKLVTFVPSENADQVLQSLFEVGAGQIGDYSSCSFQLEGTGTFLPGKEANPTIGDRGSISRVAEKRLEVMFPRHMKPAVVKALKNAHPYEEVAYYLHALENDNQEVGAGMVGELEEAMEEGAFFDHLKKSMGLTMVKHTAFRNKEIKTVAVCGGAGIFLLPHAKSARADIFITSDIKYH